MRFSPTLFFASLFWLLGVLAIPYELGWTFVLLQKMSLRFHKDFFESVCYFKENFCIYLLGLLQEKFIVSVQGSRRPLSRWQQSQFSVRTLLLSWRWLPCPQCMCTKRVSSLSFERHWSYWIRTSPLWPHLTLNTSIKDLSPNTVHWRSGLQHIKFGRHSVHNSFHLNYSISI